VNDAPLRLGLVPGLKPGKWLDRFQTRFGAESLVLVHISDDDAATQLADNAFDVGLLPLPVDKDLYYAIPLYQETEKLKRHIGLVWGKTATHPLIEEMAGIVRGRTANSSRGASSSSGANPSSGGNTSRGQANQPKAASSAVAGATRRKPKMSQNTQNRKPRRTRSK